MPTSFASIGSSPVVSVSKPTSSGLLELLQKAREVLLVVQREVLAALARRAGGGRLRRSGWPPARARCRGLRAAWSSCRSARRTPPASPRPASLAPRSLRPTGSFTSRFTVSSSRPLGSQSSALRRFSPTAPGISPACAITCVERAVLLDPFRRGLRPDLVDAGHVVHRVAGEREVVDDLRRRARRTSAARPPGRGFSFDMVLTSVTCSSTSCARSLSPVEMMQRQPWRLRLLGERGDDVVGLHAATRSAPASRAPRSPP